MTAVTNPVQTTRKNRTRTQPDVSELYSADKRPTTRFTYPRRGPTVGTALLHVDLDLGLLRGDGTHALHAHGERRPVLQQLRDGADDLLLSAPGGGGGGQVRVGPGRHNTRHAVHSES